MTIGEFAKLSGLGADLLRHYAQLGLLVPTRQANGYRNYQLFQLEQAKQIKILRQLDMPLGEIKTLLEGKNPKLLEQHETRLRQRLHEGHDALLAMRGLLRGKRQHKRLATSQVWLPPCPVLSLRQSLGWHEIGVFSRHANLAFAKLLETQQVQAVGEPLVLQHNLSFLLDRLDLEVQLPVGKKMYGSTEVLAGERPELRLLLVKHQLTAQSALPLYQQLHNQLEADGIVLGTAVWLPTHLGYLIKESP